MAALNPDVLAAHVLRTASMFDERALPGEAYGSFDLCRAALHDLGSCHAGAICAMRLQSPLRGALSTLQRWGPLDIADASARLLKTMPAATASDCDAKEFAEWLSWNEHNSRLVAMREASKHLVPEYIWRAQQEAERIFGEPFALVDADGNAIDLSSPEEAAPASRVTNTRRRCVSA